MEQWNYITCLVILCFNCNSKLHLIKSNNMLIHTKEISASFYVEDKWLQTRRSDTLIFHQEKSWVACILKTLLHLKIAQVISRQRSQRYRESLTRKAVGEIWRAEPTIRFHRSCLQRQDSAFPEHYNSLNRAAEEHSNTIPAQRLPASLQTNHTAPQSSIFISSLVRMAFSSDDSRQSATSFEV